jgi:hypothetical protein
MNARIALTEKQFRDLVAGKEVEELSSSGTIKIILSDIGYTRMRRAIDDAEDGLLRNMVRELEP